MLTVSGQLTDNEFLMNLRPSTHWTFGILSTLFFLHNSPIYEQHVRPSISMFSHHTTHLTPLFCQILHTTFSPKFGGYPKAYYYFPFSDRSNRPLDTRSSNSFLLNDHPPQLLPSANVYFTSRRSFSFSGFFFFCRMPFSSKAECVIRQD